MNINDCISSVELFNEIAGNLNSITNESLVAQAKVVAEEVNELLDAVAEGNQNEILKEAVDVLVTIHGFVKMLEAQGYDVIGAWNEVNVNNLSKFIKDPNEAQATAIYYEEQITPVTVEYSEQYDLYILKDKNGKIRKPNTYKKCSVSSFTPKGILPKVKLDAIGGDLC